jgi:hypothetical protein
MPALLAIDPGVRTGIAFRRADGNEAAIPPVGRKYPLAHP